jgi:hypothetical protein
VVNLSTESTNSNESFEVCFVTYSNGSGSERIDLEWGQSNTLDPNLFYQMTREQGSLLYIIKAKNGRVAAAFTSTSLRHVNRRRNPVVEQENRDGWIAAFGVDFDKVLNWYLNPPRSLQQNKRVEKYLVVSASCLKRKRPPQTIRCWMKVCLGKFHITPICRTRGRG